MKSIISVFYTLRVCTIWAALYTVSGSAELPFEEVVIDSVMSGDFKGAGDFDGDGFVDLVVGGTTGENLRWYHYPSWGMTEIAVPVREFTTDGDVGDVDGDGDLDIVVPDGPDDANLHWYENPLPLGDVFNGREWQKHVIGSIGDWGKDVELADFDGNGRLDVGMRSTASVMIFFQTSPDIWSRREFVDVSNGVEGMASGDIDGDGSIDLVLQGTWLRNPRGEAASDVANWSEYNIGITSSTFKALVADVNGDGVMDVLYSSSERTADVEWWTPSSGDPTGLWVGQTIAASVNRCHTLQAADMDQDGDTDVVLAQMHTSGAREVMIYHNEDGGGNLWDKQVLGTTGLHNGVVADIGGDGDYDIFGSNFTGNPPVRLWENKLDRKSLDEWTYSEMTNAHIRTFGLAFGDIDHDGMSDVVTGGFWYQNPGNDMTGGWRQSALPARLHSFVVVEVDGDGLSDIIAQRDEGDIGLYWLEAVDREGTSWNSLKVGTVPRASHWLGPQGYQTGQLRLGGNEEIAASSGDGIYYFEIPDDPDAGNWPRVHVNGNPSDEGFGLGDFDGDGNVDMAGSTGATKRVEWYRNSGNGSSEWEAFVVGEFPEAAFPDRCEVADLNGDGRLDIIISEENGIADEAETFWWEQPADLMSGVWARHLVAIQGSTNSLDVADLDADGDVDIITGEHRGLKRVIIWENDGAGNFTSHPVDQGKESHLGAQVYDLDGDGDLDIVSIAWDGPSRIHLWRNDAVTRGVVNRAPRADFSATPTSGRLPLAVKFDASSSTDPDGDPLGYIWDFGDGSMGSGVTITHTYTTEGVYRARLRISDGQVIDVSEEEIVVFAEEPDFENGLIALWRFDEVFGSTAADATSSHDGALVDDPAWRPDAGRFRGALEFDGSDDYVNVDSLDIEGGAGLSIVFWFKADDFDVEDGRFISKASGTANDEHYWMVSTADDGTALRFRLKAGDSTTLLKTGAGEVQSGLWYFIVTTYDGEMMRIYKNGLEVANTSKTGSIARNLTVLVAIGNQPSGAGSRPFDGLLDEVRIYDRALSGLEIVALFNNRSPVAKGGSDQRVGVGEDVVLDGSGSFDPDGDELSHLWTQVRGASVALSDTTGAMVSFATAALDTFAFRLTVSDGKVVGIDEVTVTSSLTTRVNPEPKHPRRFELQQNYPNPFNPKTTIGFHVPKRGHISLEVFDLTGRKVGALVANTLSAGKYGVEWDARELASGIYIYRMQADEFVSTKKMILIK